MGHYRLAPCRPNKAFETSSNDAVAGRSIHAPVGVIQVGEYREPHVGLDLPMLSSKPA
jgi:hypothetical protein